MLYLDAAPLSPDLADAASWLKNQQRGDGGFGTRELNYSSSEATAWVVITLAKLGLTVDNDDAVRKAVCYLTSCVDAHGGVSTTPLDVDQPRTFPAALALWALSLQSNTAMTCNLIIERFRATQDSETSGWGVRFGAKPNAVTTAQVLVALIEGGVSCDAEWMIRAARYVLSRQEPSGAWRNSHDEWFTKATPRIPYRTSHFGTSWALLALLPFAARQFRPATAAAVKYLISKQQPSGAWMYEDFDPTEQVWCTTQVLVALAMWKRMQPMSMGSEGGSHRVRVAVLAIGHAATRGLMWVRASMLYLLIATLFFLQFRDNIGRLVRNVGSALKVDGPGIWTNLVSSMVWASLVIGCTVIVRRVVHRERN